jgi:hypothetical protein
MKPVRKCQFCGRLFEAESPELTACPRCQAAAKRNDYPGADAPPDKQKKFVESDGFFDKNEYLSEDKKSGFFEATDYHKA